MCRKDFMPPPVKFENKFLLYKKGVNQTPVVASLLSHHNLSFYPPFAWQWHPGLPLP